MAKWELEAKRVTFLPMKENSIHSIALRHSLKLRGISNLVINNFDVVIQYYETQELGFAEGLNTGKEEFRRNSQFKTTF